MRRPKLSLLKRKKEEEEPINSDLNNDGIFDAKDKSIAAKVLAKDDKNQVIPEKSVPKLVVGEQGYMLKKPLTCDLRDGMILSMDKYNELKSRGIDIDFYL